MSLTYAIPKTSIYLQTSNTFTALFGNPTFGVYDFNRPVNAGRTVLTMQQGVIYLINRISVGGDISADEYLANLSTVPQIILQFQRENQRLYPMALPIVQFYDGWEAVAWFWSDIDGQTLNATLTTGILNQDAGLVGKPSVSINLSMSVFEITDNGFIQDFKNVNSLTRTGNRTNLQARQSFFVNTGMDNLQHPGMTR